MNAVLVLLLCVLMCLFSFHLNGQFRISEWLNKGMKLITYLVGIITYMWSVYIVFRIFYDFVK